MPESAFVDSAGLNVPDEVRDWVYGPDGPASRLAPDPEAAEFLRTLLELVGPENVSIITARPETSAAMTRAWLGQHGFPEVAIVFTDLKAAEALRSGFSYAVEDSLRHARNYAAAGVNCFLVKAGQHQIDDPRISSSDDLGSLLKVIAGKTRTPASNGAHSPLTAGLESDDHLATRPRIVISDSIHPQARERLAAAAEIIDVDGTDVRSLLAAVHDA